MSTQRYEVSASTEMITASLNGTVQDPFPLYNALREHDGGVHWAAELNGWLCTRYDDIRRIYSDNDTFSAERFESGGDDTHGLERDDHRRFMSIFTQQFMLTDPPKHTEIRSILRTSFSPRQVE